MAQPIVPSLTPAADPMEASPEPKFVLWGANEKPAAKLLATPMLDAAITGPAFQAAHRNIGWYLATEYVSDVCGIEAIMSEEHPDSGQPSKILGYRLKDEEKTLIIALTRSGEPMAQGVHAVFPSASFLHTDHLVDITMEHIHHANNIIIVDSAINTGTMLINYAEHFREYRERKEVKIVAVVGAIELQCLREGAFFRQESAQHEMPVVTLVVSKTAKYLQRDDMGHRLFNTSYTIQKTGFS